MNFNPEKVQADVERLCEEMAEIKAALVSGDGKAITQDVLDLAEFLYPHLSTIQQLAPLLPLLREQYAGQLAGTGPATEIPSIVPGSAIGRYISDKAKAMFGMNDGGQDPAKATEQKG